MSQENKQYKTQTIGLIGTGLIGGELARLSVAAGFNVVLSNSRGPESLNALVAELGSLARATSVEEAIAAADIVITPIPLQRYQSLPADKLSGKIVIDTMNYYPMGDFHIKELDEAKFTSSELVQQHLKNSKIVKAFHNVSFSHLSSIAKPKGDAERTTIPLASDNIEAKGRVAEFINAIGFNTVDAGSLAESWRIEPRTPIYYFPYSPAVPDGLSDSEARKIYLGQKVEPISPMEAKELINNTLRKFPVGGTLDMLPAIHLVLEEEWTKKRL